MSLITARLGENDIAALFMQPERKTGMSGLLEKWQKSGIHVKAARDVWSFKMVGDSPVEIKDSEKQGELLEQACDVLLISKKIWKNATLEVNSVARDSEGSDWNIKINYEWRITSPQPFYENIVKGLKTPFTSKMTEGQLNLKIQEIVKDNVKRAIDDGQRFEEIKDGYISLCSDWTSQIHDKFNVLGFGIDVTISDTPMWYSPDAEQKEKIRKENEEDRRLADKKKKWLDLDLEQKKLMREHQERLEEIEKNRILTKVQKEQELEIARKEFEIVIAKKEKELIEAKISLEKVQLDWVLQKAKTEEEVARVKVEIQRLESGQAQIEQELKDEMVARRAFIEVAPVILDDLLSPDEERRNQAIQRLGREYLYTPSQVQKIIRLVMQSDRKSAPFEKIILHFTKQGFIDGAHEKKNKQKRHIKITKKEFGTREIGPKKVKVNTLAINQSLALDIHPDRSGYLWLYNVGTSGKVYRHCPNAHTRIEEAKVEAGQVYSFPGSHLLPYNVLTQRDLGYYEQGPLGWEYLIAIVTTDKVVLEDSMPHTGDYWPFTILGDEDLRKWAQTLSSLPEDSWSVGLTEFLVE